MSFLIYLRTKFLIARKNEVVARLTMENQSFLFSQKFYSWAYFQFKNGGTSNDNDKKPENKVQLPPPH